MIEQGPLEQSWRRAWAALRAQGDGAQLMAALLSAYSEPQRKYHTLQHLSECVAALAPNLALAEHPGEFEIALWFHDAVYDVKGHENELQSAQWAERELQAAGVLPEAIDRVKQLIMATCHSALPTTTDAKLLVDVDLSILGAPKERFDEYENQIRQEYAWVPGIIFRRKRREVLAEFLARPQIYSTPPFRDALEARARENLQRSLSRLKPWYKF